MIEVKIAGTLTRIPEEKLDDSEYIKNVASQLSPPSEVETPKLTQSSIFSGSVPEMASKIVQRGTQYPMGMSVDPRNIVRAMREGVSSSYYELMPQLEKGAEVTAEAARKSMPDQTAPIVKYVLTPVAMSVFPPRPSMMAGAIGAGAFTPEINLPNMLRSPLVVEEGLNSAVSKLGRPDMSLESIGQNVRQSFPKQTNLPIAEPPKVYLEPTTSSKVGETIQRAYKTKVGDLYKKEKAAWDVVSEQHFDKPANLENTKKYIEDLSPQESVTNLDRLNPNQKEIAMRTANPEETATGMIQFGGQSKNVNPMISESPQGDMTPEVQNAQIQRGYGLISKIYDITSEPTTFGRLKNLRSQLDSMIDYTKRGDTLNYQLKGIRKELTRDMESSAKAGNFEGEVENAVNATKDYYRYVENPTSKIINNVTYPSQLEKRLIKADTPEMIDELFKEHNLTTDDKRIVGNGVLNSLISSSGKNIDKFRTSYGKYPKEVRTQLFGEKNAVIESILGQKVEGTTKFSPEVENLGKIVNKGNPSEVVNNVLSDGSPETARMIRDMLGKEKADLISKGIINKFINESSIETPKGKTLSLEKLTQKFSSENLSPEFISEMFGDNAKMVKAIQDASTSLKSLSKETKSRFPYEEVSAGAGVGYLGGGPAGAAIGAMIGRTVPIFKNLFNKYRIPSKISEMLERTQGKGISEMIVPKSKSIKFPIPSLLGKTSAMAGNILKTPSGVEYSIIEDRK